MLATNFIARRIHVDHDWDGARLLSILENSLTKSLPYEDDFSKDNGWITAWGSLDIGRNNFVLRAEQGIGGASTLLDGTAIWDNYSFDVTANWQDAYLLVMGDVVNSKTYDACVFSPGMVRIQSIVNGETKTFATQKDPNIQYSSSARAGIRVHGSAIECSWNYGSIADSYMRAHAGGIGIQTWSGTPGTAQIQVDSIIVRSLTGSTTPQNQ